MLPIVVVDTGPLVAYFNRLDRDHERVKTWFEHQARRFRLLSTEAVVTEGSHLLGFDVALQTDFIDWVAASIEIETMTRHAYRDLTAWMRGYANIPLDFADATLLWLYRASPNAALLTLDERGFGVFRLPEDKRRRLKLIDLPEPGRPPRKTAARRHA